MKLTQIGALILLIPLICPWTACAQARQSYGSGSGSHGDPVKIEASVIDQFGTSVRAKGSVMVLQRDRKLTAEEMSYDWSTGRAELSNATFTTCTARNPDYRITARSVTLLPRNRVRFRRVSVYLGRTRLLSLPGIIMRVGTKKSAGYVLPRVGHDKDSGWTLAHKFAVVDNDRAFATTELRVSAKDGFECDFEGAFGLDGFLTSAQDEPLIYPAFRSAGLAVPTPSGPKDDVEEEDPANLARLRGFARFSSRFRTYDSLDPDLRVYRQPELGLQYTARPINLGRFELDPRLPIRPVAGVSWGQFKEEGDSAFNSRLNMGFTLPINVASVGKSTVIQPAVQVSQSTYESGRTYTWAAGGLGVSHIRRDGTLESLRYIRRGQRGTTPFQFDRVHIVDELQGAIQFQRHRHVLALVAGYDLGRGEIYDWSVLYGHRTDCLAATIAWNNLEEQILFNIRILSK